MFCKVTPCICELWSNSSLRKNLFLPPNLLLSLIYIAIAILLMESLRTEPTSYVPLCALAVLSLADALFFCGMQASQALNSVMEVTYIRCDI